MSSKRILMLGCGKIGLRVANLLCTEHKVWGLSRNSQANTAKNIEFITADVCDLNKLKTQIPENLDYVIYCLTPSERSEQAYRQVYLTGLNNLFAALPEGQHLKRLYFISSTGVYHQNNDEVVDESSTTFPTSFSGQVLLEAEALCTQSIHPSTIIRFSGIYGGQRSRLIEQVKKGEAKLSNKPRLTNRIHEDDCVGFICHLIQEDMQGKNNERLYLASDERPVDLNDVLRFLASKLSLELAHQSESKKDTRRAGNKKCSNLKMLESGYKLRFTGYQEGYSEMLNLTNSTP